jgi:hypothetical protein
MIYRGSKNKREKRREGMNIKKTLKKVIKQFKEFEEQINELQEAVDAKEKEAKEDIYLSFSDDWFNCCNQDYYNVSRWDRVKLIDIRAETHSNNIFGVHYICKVQFKNGRNKSYDIGWFEGRERERDKRNDKKNRDLYDRFHANKKGGGSSCCC